MIPRSFSTPSNRRPSHRRARANSAFSLLELFIVLVLIIIMFTLYFSRGSKSYQSKQLTACSKNLENLYVVLSTYSLTNGAFPSLTNTQTSEPVLSQLVPFSTTSTEFFICPGSRDAALPDGKPFENHRISYAYYMGHKTGDSTDQPLLSDRQVNTADKLRGQQLFSPDGKKPGNNHDKFGGNVLFCDGNVQHSPARAAFDLTNAPNIILLNPRP